MARPGSSRTVRSALAGTARAAKPAGPRGPPRRTLHTSPAAGSEAVGPAAELPDAPTPAPAPRETLASIRARRAAAGPLRAGTAAYASSDMFKAPAPAGTPQGRSWDHLFSREGAARRPCVLKQAARHLGRPGLISLGGGLPSPTNFPISELTVRAAAAAGGGEEVSLTMGKFDAAVSGRGGAAEYDLGIALNYAQAGGSAQLLRWVTEHVALATPPGYAGWRCALTVGSTGALEQALRLVCDAARGDALLTEEWAFSTAVETAAPLGLPVFGVPMDGEGLRPAALDEMLAGWDARARGVPRPRVLYTVPSGQNPTGATMGPQRRRDVYEVCRRHDVFIIEDEPYYFLQLPPYRGRSGAGGPEPAPPAEADEADNDAAAQAFLDGLPPSLLSLDGDGRVLRLDSFSKVVVPGARLGWATGAADVVDRLVRHNEVCSQGPAGFSQAVLFTLLDGAWGHAGYLRWLARLRDEYTRRRDGMLAACEDHLPAVVSWAPPGAGMFHWLRVDHTRHPDAETRSILEIEEDIFDRCIGHGVLVGRGSWFRAEQDKPPTGLYFRATYASATPDQVTEAVRRFGQAVRESFRMQ